MPDAANLCALSGRLLERGALRYTPAGIPVVEFRIGHNSEQIEADRPRKVECEMACVAIGSTAKLMSDAKPGEQLRIGGFLAAKSLSGRGVVLHVNTIEFVEGNPNGFQIEK